MYAFISGNLEYVGLNNIVIENSGIGYDITVSATTIDKVQRKKSVVKVYTYLYVKEDGIALFGFHSNEEKEMFLKLISVSGVGPKIAIQILSGTTPENLKSAIVTGDTSHFSKIKGIGKKTAERIILELKGQISDLGLLAMPILDVKKSSAFEETIMAMMALGFTQSEAVKSVSKVKEQADTPEALLALALRNINR